MASGSTIASGDTTPRSTGSAPRPRFHPRRAGRSDARTETRNRSASASRPTTRCAASLPRGSSVPSGTPGRVGLRHRRFQPLGSVQVVVGTSPHGQDSRDDVRPGRRRRTRCERRRRRGAARRHCRVQLGMDTYGAALADRRRHCSLQREPEDHRQGAPDRRRPARGSRRTTSSSRAGRSA